MTGTLGPKLTRVNWCPGTGLAVASVAVRSAWQGGGGSRGGATATDDNAARCPGSEAQQARAEPGHQVPDHYAEVLVPESNSHVAVVFGGASGIGAACATALAADGYDVEVADLPDVDVT